MGREPTVGELSERLGVEQEELVMALDAGGDVESLHKPIYQKDGQEIRLMDKLEEKSEEHEQVLNHIVLTELLGVLNQDEKDSFICAILRSRPSPRSDASLEFHKFRSQEWKRKYSDSLKMHIFMESRHTNI